MDLHSASWAIVISVFFACRPLEVKSTKVHLKIVNRNPNGKSSDSSPG